jgi:23S rRNA (guanosine2251-2'-O)-methyltransferase
MQQATEFVFGIHPCIKILASKKRPVRQIYILSDKRNTYINRILKMAKRREIQIIYTDKKKLDHITNRANHQGVAILTQKTHAMSLRQALLAEKNENPIWLAINEITDPQNLGAILRSAACLGVTTVLLPQRRTVGITPTVQKTASGALEDINIVSIANLNQAIIELKKNNFWVYGAEMSGTPITKVTYAKPMLLVIGSEGEGLKHKTAEHCDELISIPQAGGVESLNAACACAIILYDVLAKTQKA